MTGFNGGNCNATTGDFSYGVEGFRIRNGKVAEPVGEMLVTGNIYAPSGRICWPQAMTLRRPRAG